MSFAAMGRESQEAQGDDILAAFDIGQDHDYPDELGTQVPIDMGGSDNDNENNMAIDEEDVVSNIQTSNAQTDSMNNRSSKHSSTATVVRLRDDEDVVDVEGYSSDIEDLRKPFKIENEDAARGNNAAGFIKLEDDEIVGSDLHNQLIDITDSDDEQDVNVNVKTEPADAPFQWNAMGRSFRSSFNPSQNVP